MNYKVNLKYNTTYASEQAADIVCLSENIEVINENPTYKKAEHAVVLPRKAPSRGENSPYQGLGGVVDKDGNFLVESAVYDLGQETKLAFGGKYEIKESNTETVNENAIYLGLAHRHWGHFLLDVVQRLWIIDELENISDCKLVFAGFGDGNTEFNGSFRRFLELAGVDISKIYIVNSPTRFLSLIVPNVIVYPGRWINERFSLIFKRVVNNCMAQITGMDTIDKIYFSRSKISGNREIGEDRIEYELSRCGYKILHPESLSLDEQIYYWQTANRIACINGSIPHNCVFAHKNLELIIFIKMSRMVGYQFTMDAVWGKTPIYVSAYKEPLKRYPLSVSRGPFWIVVTEDFMNYIGKEENSKITKYKLGVKAYLQYLKCCIIAELRYQLRGSKNKLRRIIRQ